MGQQRHAERHVRSVEPDGFFGRHGFVAERLGQLLAAELTIVTAHDGRLRRYRAGVYVADAEDVVRRRVRELLDDRWRARHAYEVIEWLRAHEPVVTGEVSVDYINLANGLLYWRDGELRPHTPAAGSTVQIPHRWCPEATCPRIDRFLGEVLPADAVGFMHELAGYLLYAGNPLRKAVLFHGAGRNGKSKLLALLRALLGSANCSSVTIQSLAENRFTVAELDGKLANIAGDLDARAVKRTDVFKMLTGGDPITAERKFGAPFTFTPIAVPVFSANEPPISSDQTQAWFDRWIIVPFPHRFEGVREDPHLETRITASAELEGFLVHAVRGLQRLMARGRFDLPPSIEQAGGRYRTKLDTVAAFVEDECRLQPDAWVKQSALYASYAQWARDSGRLPVSASNFNDHLRSNLGDRVEEKKRGVKGWLGIGLADVA